MEIWVNLTTTTVKWCMFSREKNQISPVCVEELVSSVFVPESLSEHLHMTGRCMQLSMPVSWKQESSKSLSPFETLGSIRQLKQSSSVSLTSAYGQHWAQLLLLCFFLIWVSLPKRACWIQEHSADKCGNWTWDLGGSQLSTLQYEKVTNLLVWAV